MGPNVTARKENETGEDIGPSELKCRVRYRAARKKKIKVQKRGNLSQQPKVGESN